MNKANVNLISAWILYLRHVPYFCPPLLTMNAMGWTSSSLLYAHYPYRTEVRFTPSVRQSDIENGRGEVKGRAFPVLRFCVRCWLRITYFVACLDAPTRFPKHLARRFFSLSSSSCAILLVVSLCHVIWKGLNCWLPTRMSKSFRGMPNQKYAQSWDAHYVCLYTSVHVWSRV